MIVVRVEHAERGNGPYRLPLRGAWKALLWPVMEVERRLADDICEDHSNLKRGRPNWYDDGLANPGHYCKGKHYPKQVCMNNDEWRSACPSIEALRQWFDGFLPRLYQAGYVVREYEVEYAPVGRSGIQTVFHLPSATMARTLALEEVRELASA